VEGAAQNNNNKTGQVIVEQSQFDRAENKVKIASFIRVEWEK